MVRGFQTPQRIMETWGRATRLSTTEVNWGRLSMLQGPDMISSFKFLVFSFKFDSLRLIYF
jgi:hypothetical protein